MGSELAFYTYDLLNRLTSQTSAASNRTYSYDATGNRIQRLQSSPIAEILPAPVATTSNRSSALLSAN